MSRRDNALGHKSHRSLVARPPIWTSHYTALSRIMNILSGTREKSPALPSRPAQYVGAFPKKEKRVLYRTFVNKDCHGIWKRRREARAIFVPCRIKTSNTAERERGMKFSLPEIEISLTRKTHLWRRLIHDRWYDCLVKEVGRDCFAFSIVMSVFENCS